MTTQVQFVGEGPFETPVARGFAGMAVSTGQSPTRIRFVLAGGQELLVPIEELALRRMYKLLHGQFGEKP
jgi:hypothetical protein